MIDETTTEQLAEIDRDMADIDRQVAELVEEAQQADYKTQELPTKTQELETKTQELPEYTPPEGWRLVRFGELLLPGDEIVQIDDGRRYPTHRIGDAVGPNQQYIRRIKPHPDDPSGPGWRDVEPDELLQDGDMLKNNTGLWLRTGVPGRLAREGWGGTYRRRIEPQQASDSEPETMEDLRRRLAECEVLLAEADRGGQQVNAELQQLREQLQTLTRERDRYRNQLAGAIEHSKAPEAQALPTKTQELETKTQELPAEYTPPEGWRVLAVGEALREGDVTVRKDGYCYPTERVGGWVGANQRYIRPIEPEPRPEPEPEVEPDAATIEELRSEVSYVQRLLGESNRKVTQLEDLVGSLRAINEAQEKAFEAAGKANTDLQHRLNVVAAEWAEQAETIRRLQIELDAAQQVPQAIADRFEEGWNQGTARAVETVLEWLQPFRGCNSPALALLLLEALPHIMRHLTGLAED